MKKILVLHRYPPKQVIGTNASFIEFLKKLLQEGFKVYYLTYKEKDIEQDGGLENIVENKNFKFVRLPFYFNRGDNFDKKLKTYLWLFLAPLYVRKLQNKHKLDLVYCDDSVPYYGFFSKLVSPKSKIIIRLGDLQSGYAWADENPTLFKLALKIEKFMWKKMDGIVAISDTFKQFLIRQEVDERKVRVVKESINLDQVNFSEVKVPITGKIMFHGSLVKCKGLKTLLDAFKIFQQKYPKAKLVIAGGGEEESKLVKYVKEQGLGNIEFTGWYDHKTLEKVMKDVQISVVMRSGNIANNFVVTTCLLESWAYKKPVLVPRLSSFQEVIKDWENGVFFEPGNAEDLAEKMGELYKNEDRYKDMAVAGLKSAKETFNHKKIAEDMANVIKYFLSKVKV